MISNLYPTLLQKNLGINTTQLSDARTDLYSVYYSRPAFLLPGGMNSIMIPTPDQKKGIAITLMNAAWYLIIHSDQFIDGDRLELCYKNFKMPQNISDTKRLKRPKIHSIKLGLLNVYRS